MRTLFLSAAFLSAAALSACGSATRRSSAPSRSGDSDQSPERGIHVQIRKQVKTGFRLWERSCPRPLLDGLCVAVEYQPTKVGAPTNTERHFRYLHRKQPLVRAARKHFRKALDIWKVGGSPDTKTTPEDELKSRTQALHWVAMARFMLVDMDFEDYVKSGSPGELGRDLKDRAASRKAMLKLRHWFQKKTETATRLRMRYEDVMKVQSGRWAVPVLARIGGIFKHFARQMAEFPVPAFLTTRPARDAFMVNMDSFIQPLEAKAGKVFGMCLKMAAKHKIKNEWSRLCRMEKEALGTVPKMNRRIILRVIRKHAADLHRCYRTHGLASNPKLNGRVMVRFIVPQTGIVSNAGIVRTSLADPKTQNCILKNIRTWRFPRHRGKPARVTYPFRFEPATTTVAPGGQPPP